MDPNYYSITFWFNIFEEHEEILKIFQEELKDEYQEFSIFNYTDNLIAPIIRAVNNKKMTNISFSQINLQYTMDKVNLKDLVIFQEKALKLFELLTEYGIEISHTAIFINLETIDDNPLENITKNTISKNLYSNDLIDISLKLGKKHEDLFYKIITLLNKKQIKLPKKVDEKGKIIPIPLTSWHGAFVEHELIEITYEINDKYLFDNTKNYHTSVFLLNKMLYILKENLEEDIKNILENGTF